MGRALNETYNILVIFISHFVRGGTLQLIIQKIIHQQKSQVNRKMIESMNTHKMGIVKMGQTVWKESKVLNHHCILL